MSDPRQAAYAEIRRQWREFCCSMEPYQHPDGSPVTPYVADALAKEPERVDAALGAAP